MAKPQSQRISEKLFDEATEAAQPSSRDIRFLTTGLIALCKTDEKRLNNIEFNALCGMIAYVAHTQNVDEAVVMEILLSKFQAEDLRKMPSKYFQTALEYLVDLDVGKVVN